MSVLEPSHALVGVDRREPRHRRGLRGVRNRRVGLEPISTDQPVPELLAGAEGLIGLWSATLIPRAPRGDSVPAGGPHRAACCRRRAPNLLRGDDRRNMTGGANPRVGGWPGWTAKSEAPGGLRHQDLRALLARGFVVWVYGAGQMGRGR